MISINLTLISGVVFFLIANGVFASFVLILKKENNRANRYLSVLTLFLSLWLCDMFFRVSDLYGQRPDLYFLPIYFSFGFGPLIYFYTLELTRRDHSFSLKHLIHFLPVLLQFLFYCFLQSKDYAFRREFWFTVHQPYTFDIELIISFLLLTGYLVLSRAQVRTYKSQIENSFSDIHNITLNWLNRLHQILIALSILWLVEAAARLLFNFYPATPFSSITIGLVIIFIAVGGILQKDLSSTKQTLSTDLDNLDGQPSPTDSVDTEQVKRIQRILIEKELFLIPDITLKDFSEHTGLSARETSRLINQGLHISFIDFINLQRVARFKELVSTQNLEKYSLLGLALESGFNSKSTFNRVFKKMEGKSPSAYLNES